MDELEQKRPSEAKLVNMSVTTDCVSMTRKTGSKDIAADVIAQLRTFESIMVSNVSTITEDVYKRQPLHCGRMQADRRAVQKQYEKI